MADLKPVQLDETGGDHAHSSSSALALPMADAKAPLTSITDIKSAREGRRVGNRERPERAERIPRAERVDRDGGGRRINRRNPGVGEAESPDIQVESNDNQTSDTADLPNNMIAAASHDEPSVVEPQSPIEETKSTARTQSILVAPLVDTSQGNRSNDRTRNQLVAAEQAMLQSKDVTSAIAPLVRHINTVTERLNESQEQVGRLASERDALRAHLIQVTGMSTDQVAVIATRGIQESDVRSQQRLARMDTRADQVAHVPAAEEKISGTRKFADRTGLFIKDEFSPEEIKFVARRRQLVALALFAFLGVGLYVAQATGNNIGDMSKNGLADIAFVGVFFQMFLMMWMMYRVVRVGGKGAHWLFPDSNAKRRRH